MASRKLKDLAVKTGSYEKNGETKSRFENVGSLFDDGKGGQFILLKRTFNPAGVPTEPDRDQILVSVFDLRDEPEPRRDRQAPAPKSDQGAQGPRGGLPDDDIPFLQHERGWLA
jgi:hypothetical protein